jgi:hypothetical protein
MNSGFNKAIRIFSRAGDRRGASLSVKYISFTPSISSIIITSIQWRVYIFIEGLEAFPT